MIGRLTTFLGASLLAVPAHADDFPTKPITLIVRDRHAGATGRAAGFHGAGAADRDRQRPALAEVLEKELALWQRVAQASGVRLE